MRYELIPENITENVFFKKDKLMFMRLLNLFNSKQSWKKDLTKDKNADLRKWISECVPLLTDGFYTPETKAFWIFNGLTDFPKCANENCNMSYVRRNVKTVRKGYPEFCSHKCAANCEKTKARTATTCLAKYGVSSPGQSESAKKKSRKTCLERYGVEYSFQSEDVREKSKAACIEKYGEEIASKSVEIQEKIRRTKIEKYGDSQPWHSADAIEKRKKTWIEKFGADHPMKSDAAKENARSTNIAKYGKDFWSQTGEFAKSRAVLSYEKNISASEYDVPLFSPDEYAKRKSDNEPLKFKCRKCGHEFLTPHRDGKHGRCPICWPSEPSKCEKEIADFVRELGFDIQTDVRTVIRPKELDVYVPDRKFAIEFDGLYWHSESTLAEMHRDENPKAYHVRKTDACESAGIRLVHVFENEWKTKREIVKSRLKDMLGIYGNTVFARKCEIREVSSDEARKFQDENHIQGAVNSAVRLGLYFENELISLMTFGKCRFDKRHEWEMLRFCNKLGYHIPGAASKLLKHFEKTYSPKSLVSYADRRWSEGNLYRALNFTFINNSNPNYWYFRKNSLQLESRVKYQKHKLAKLLPVFDPSKTEVENMKDNGYFRIFDCGNMVFEKTYN